MVSNIKVWKIFSIYMQNRKFIPDTAAPRGSKKRL